MAETFYCTMPAWAQCPWALVSARVSRREVETLGLGAMVAVTNTRCTAERSYRTSQVRGRSREDPMPQGWRPRGVTPRLRSRAAAESARLQWRRNGKEELLKSEVRGGGREELLHVQVRGGVRGQGQGPGGAIPHQRGPGGPTPHPRPWAAAGRANPTPRSDGCAGTGGPRGTIPH